ncbi:Chitin synthase export chaperone [Leucoagaricus sp. SymC.cos]|nr:Chitin synthase export chaperone [Leucoagaricus sp. SymC.cos]
MVGFGDFQPLCNWTPSYTWCNLFYRQLLDRSPDTLQGPSVDPQSAPVGVNPRCGIPRVGHDGSVSNVANIAACGVSILVTALLIFLCNRRKAAVGRWELRTFLVVYLITLPFQILTNGSLLPQGSTALVVLTAIHAGLVVALFWLLITNAIVATQWIEDGTMTSIAPLSILALILFGGTLYICLDIGFGVTETLGGLSNPPERIKSIPLFVLTSIWPIVSIIIYLALMSYIVLHVLNETRPMWYYLLSITLFVLAQLAWFLLSRVICRGSNQKIDGSFIATVLETAAVGMLFLAWRSITEETWDDGFEY